MLPLLTPAGTCVDAAKGRTSDRMDPEHVSEPPEHVQEVSVTRMWMGRSFRVDDGWKLILKGTNHRSEAALSSLFGTALNVQMVMKQAPEPLYGLQIHCSHWKDSLCSSSASRPGLTLSAIITVLTAWRSPLRSTHSHDPPCLWSSGCCSSLMVLKW